MLAETTAAMDGMRLGSIDPMTMEVAIGVEEATQKLPPIPLSAPTAHPLLEAQSGFEAQEELAAQEEMAAQASKEVVPDVVGYGRTAQPIASRRLRHLAVEPLPSRFSSAAPLGPWRSR